MVKNIHLKFWLDKEFDSRLYDIALKEKANKNNLIDCLSLFTGNNCREISSYKYKFLQRVFEFIGYYSEKKIFLEDNVYDEVSISSLIRNIIMVNGYITNKKLNYYILDPILILDKMVDNGYKIKSELIYKLQFTNLLTINNPLERYDIKDLDTYDHLLIINDYGKILMPTNFSLKTFENFCMVKMKKSIVEKLLKYLKPNIKCLENACKHNDLVVITMLIESNNLVPTIKCMENAFETKPIIAPFLFNYIKKDYNEMKEKLDKKIEKK